MPFAVAKSVIAGFSKDGFAPSLPLALQRWMIQTG
jgi:hypothetical protein